MPAQANHHHIEVTETLVRLYVFLAQYLDRCLNESAREGLSEQDLEQHLSSTRSSLMEILSVNPVVQGKVARECERVLDLGTACLKGKAAPAGALQEVERERTVLQNKTIALSDLLAVFRALET